MEEIARQALQKLLRAADRSAAGVRSRAPALTLSHLRDYRALRSLAHKEACDAVFKDAAARGAIELTWDGDSRSGFVERVTLKDPRVLAQVLGTETAAARIDVAIAQLAEHAGEFSALTGVFERWKRLERVRGFGPSDASAWRDAVQAIRFARQEVSAEHELPLRVASARLFKDSKRLERIVPAIDVLLMGAVDADPRETDQVWRELGFYREEQLVRLSGDVIIERDRCTARLDAPFAGLPASAIRGVKSVVSFVMTIENQTTFSVTARERCNEPVLLIYSGGMPSPSWLHAYSVIIKSIPEETPIFHWGDIDEGGFRIAARIARDVVALGRELRPWKMDPRDVPPQDCRPVSQSTAERMSKHALDAGWNELAIALSRARVALEQESLHAGSDGRPVGSLLRP